MHRSRGNVVGSEERKSLNPRVVGTTAVAGRDLDSSGKSSGIGSEEGEIVNGGNSSPLDDGGFLPDQDDRSSSGTFFFFREVHLDCVKPLSAVNVLLCGH